MCGQALLSADHHQKRLRSLSAIEEPLRRNSAAHDLQIIASDRI